ncbi:MAG: ROK family protein [Actinobacteria bacterium]|nr:ROK family protein [Actinomycetota bacterium]
MYRIGVDLGGTKIQTVVVNKKSEVKGQDRRETPRSGGPKDVTKTIADSVKAAIKDAGKPLDKILGIGVGGPGQIDARAGTLSNAGNLPGWKLTYPLGTELSKRVKLPVDLGNDVQVAVRGEAELGAGRPYNSFLGLWPGTGVGGGIVIQRKMWLGRGAAGEIGHTVINAVNGPPCSCGHFGCVEAYAGRGSMTERANLLVAQGHHTRLFEIQQEKGKDRLTSGVWAKAIKEKDKMAMELLDRAIWALGQGAGSAVNLLDVDAVIIGGGLGVRFGQDFADRIGREAHTRLLRPDKAPDFVVAELGDLGGAIGAALLPLD